MERWSWKAALRLVGRVMEGRNRYERFDSSAPVLVYCACRALAKRKRRSKLQVAILDFVCVMCCEHFFFWVFSCLDFVCPRQFCKCLLFFSLLLFIGLFNYGLCFASSISTNLVSIYLTKVSVVLFYEFDINCVGVP